MEHAELGTCCGDKHSVASTHQGGVELGEAQVRRTTRIIEQQERITDEMIQAGAGAIRQRPATRTDIPAPDACVAGSEAAFRGWKLRSHETVLSVYRSTLTDTRHIIMSRQNDKSSRSQRQNKCAR